LTIGSFDNIRSPQLKRVFPNTLVTNNPRKKTITRVKIIPNPGISTPIWLRIGAAIPSKKENKNFNIQKVTAMGTIAKRPAKIRRLINCNIILSLLS
jgi:hypothetical protein